MKGPVACFGEVLLRFSAADGTALRDAARLDVHVGGAEANVAVALANLGLETRMISTLPSNPLGMLATKALRREGVDCSDIATGEGSMGSYFLSPAAGARSGEVLYDRTASAFALAGPRDVSVLEGAHHLHVSGISLAVSEAASAAVRALTGAAKDKGLTVSFDGNFRPSLWAASNREPRGEIAEMVGMADLFFGNHKDISLLLGRTFSGDGGARRREAALALLDAFPGLGTIASTARQVEDGHTHRITARIDTRAAAAESRERVLPGIIDRIGTGDAFAAGVLTRWLEQPEALQQAVEGGAALAALKHYEPGDFCRASATEWRQAMEGTGDVSR